MTKKKNTKGRNTKSHKKKKLNFPAIFLAVLVVVLIVLGVGYFLKNGLRNSLGNLKDKVDDYTPNGFTYPTKYEEYVVKYSKEYDVDPTLVFSVIKVESDFNSNAVSDVGARGLMQLMEDAYDWIKFRLDDDRDHSYDDMFEPELNIQYGTYYLSYLMDKYDNSIELSAAAYHCGMGLVDGWLEDGTVDAENFDVNDIPDGNEQTAHYVKKIEKAYVSYEEILSSTTSVD
jgi:soluble lytic murein transglycosylase